eukprot:COSAG02_NODE_4803_length_4959_cov_3.932716_1_plen_56_part_00
MVTTTRGVTPVPEEGREGTQPHGFQSLSCEIGGQTIPSNGGYTKLDARCQPVARG